MKIVTNIIRFILMIIFTICLVSFVVVNLISSTAFNQEYVLKKFEDFNYYLASHEIVKSNFENYIYQSGLDISVLDGICTEDKVKQDVNIVISNIYKNENKEIDSKEIADKLNENIYKTGVRTSKNQKAIEKFVGIIANEYKDSILPKKYEDMAKSAFNKVNNIINNADKYILIGLIASFVLLVIFSLNSIYKALQSIGVPLFAAGLFSLILEYFINTRIYIAGIRIYNDTLSNIIIMTANEILNKIVIFGICAMCVGIFMIIISTIFKKDKKKSRRKI